MLSAVCELLADETDAVEVGSHSKFLVLNLRLLCRCTFLCEGLVVEGQGKYNIATYLACMKLTVEAPKLYRLVPCEKTV